MVSPDKFALIERWERELSPEEIAATHFADADIVLCEGFKASQLPKIEIHRAEAHAAPLWPAPDFDASTWRAMLSDVSVPDFPGAHFDLASDGWVGALTDWIEREVMR